MPVTCLHALLHFLKQVKFTTSSCLCDDLCVRACVRALLTNFRGVCSLLMHFFSWRKSPFWEGYSHCRGFTITLRRTTLVRTSLDEWSAPFRDLYLTAHNTHNRQTSMPLVWSEPATPASERPQTHALDRAATTIDSLMHSLRNLRNVNTSRFLIPTHQ
jgi:hypothetical protein